MLMLRVKMKEEHPLARFGARLRLWSKPSAENGVFTAGCLVALGWIAFALACAESFPKASLWPWILVGGLDLLLRMWGIRSTVYFIPIWVWTFGIWLLVTLARNR